LTPSPEEIELKAQEIHKKSDMFSLGYCIFEILTRGRSWLVAETEYEALLAEIMQGGKRPIMPPYLLELSAMDGNIARLLNIVSCCWDSNPDTRLSSQGAVMDLGNTLGI
jgi:serine/threonine protein kinase